MIKSDIVTALGEDSLLLPVRLNEALLANDRVKYYFALLQAARSHADAPERPFSRLQSEREACRVDDVSLDRIVERSSQIRSGDYCIPDFQGIRAAIVSSMRDMLSPLQLAGPGSVGEVDEFASRLSRLEASLPSGDQDCVSAGQVAAITAADRDSGDTMHLLVMDMHKAINRLQASVAVESLFGAAVYGLAAEDREFVGAFMAGLQSTSFLKYDHPGLGTTATRCGGRLVIQNDIGTTDAHVLVLNVSDRVTTVTYTDVHRRRARFFQSMLEEFDVDWDDLATRRATKLPDNSEFQLVVGRHVAADAAEQLRYLRHVGSRIVFLIDWNRARKRLQLFVPSVNAIDVLKWAADHDIGHRAFLQAGGETLIFNAIERAGSMPIRYGQRLDEVLGVETAESLLKFLLRTCTAALQCGRSVRWIRDEVTAELLTYVQSSEELILDIACDHAALIAETAEAARAALNCACNPARAADLPRLAERAKRWETTADELRNQVRERVVRAPSLKFYRTLVEETDSVIDNLEEAVFLLSLSGDVTAHEPARGLLERLASVNVEAARELIKSMECLGPLLNGSVRDDMQDFLEAVHRAQLLEHTGDDLEREILATLLGSKLAGAQTLLYSQLASQLETAGDGMSRAALMLRDHVLQEVAMP